MRIDETNNECDGDGCPWSSTWWAMWPAVDTRVDCPAQTPVPRINGNGKRCCRYYTLPDRPCANRLWILDGLDSTKTLTVDGRQYTLNLQGLSLDPFGGVMKDYFIAQEDHKTAVALYARLVDACPLISMCPEGQAIVGLTCQCICPLSPCPQGPCGFTCLFFFFFNIFFRAVKDCYM